jgi:hypothetical protein
MCQGIAMKKMADLRKAIVEVRLMPTIDLMDSSIPVWLDHVEASSYAHGYNAAIEKMRRIFEENGITA